MRKIFSMSAVLIVALLFSLVCPTRGRNSEPNLSGTWLLDKSKSDPLSGRRPGLIPGEEPIVHPDITLVIDHQSSSIKIKRNVVLQGKEQSQELLYTTDGKETKNPGITPGIEVTSKSHWEGDKLTSESVEEHMTSAGGRLFRIKEVWSLSKDGKTLTVTTGRKTPFGDVTSKRVYNKK